MQFPPSFLDELRSRILPSEVVRRKVALKTHGREHTGLCPFHKEKSPSFTVSDEKGFYHCFGCSAHGDIVKFVMETEKLPFLDAVKQLATMAGMALPVMDKRTIEREKQAQSLYEIMEAASCYFEEKLEAKEGAAAREYLQKRGLKASSIKKFRIGFAPDGRRILKQYLENSGVSTQNLLDVGLVTKSDTGDIYDKFRNRIMFPIIDVKGRIIAFGGRAMGDRKPKYLNSPETVLFKKGEILYNENNARRLAMKTGKIVVAEGYMDVIALDAAGITTGVAPLGTAVTERHIKRLWNMAKEPVICLDGDAAGRRAMERVAHLCLPTLEPGYTLKFAAIIDGMDPDDFIKKAGAEAMRKTLQNAKPLSDVLWECELIKHDIKTPEKKAEFENQLMHLAVQIKNQTVARHYKDYFSKKLWELKRNKGKAANNIVKTGEMAQTSDFRIETMLLLTAFNYPEILHNHDVYEEFASETLVFPDNNLDKIRHIILEVCSQNEAADNNFIKAYLENSGFASYIKYLDELKKDFLITKNADISKVLLLWKYNIALHHLTHLKIECETTAKEMTPESEDVVSEFRKQIYQLETDIKKMQMAFGD